MAQAAEVQQHELCSIICHNNMGSSFTKIEWQIRYWERIQVVLCALPEWEISRNFA